MKKILWVDDQPLSLLSTAKHLELNFHIQFDFASTFNDALLKMSSVKYDALMLDIIIPLYYDDKLVKGLSSTFFIDYETYPGVSLIDIIINKKTVSPLIMPDSIFVCTNYDFHLLISMHPFLKKCNLRYFPKSKITDYEALASALKSSSRKPSEITIVKFDPERKFGEKAAQLETIIHDFKNFYNGLYQVLSNAAKQMNDDLLNALLLFTYTVVYILELLPLLYFLIVQFLYHILASTIIAGFFGNSGAEQDNS